MQNYPVWSARAALLAFCLFWATTVFSQVVNFTNSTLPILVINTNGQPVPDEPKINATLGVIDKGPGQINFISDPFNGYNGPIGIELRGSSSQFYDKKPYSIELRDANGEDFNAPLLGMPAESDWALISPLNDKTLMRDALAHAFARQTLPWSPRTRYCEVVLNGNYIGVYLLVETIKRDNNRVDIKKLEPQDTVGNDLTGGYILRMDKYGPTPGSVGGDWKSGYPPMPGAWQETWFQYFRPEADELHPKQAAYIRNHINAFELMLKSPNFSTEYDQWIDKDSWADYLLINELTKNTDGYRLSAYFYKDRDDVSPLLQMGPIWDYNIAFGIGDYCDGQLWTGWAKDFNSVCPGDSWIIHFWWERLWQEPTFRRHIKERWQTLRAGPWSNQRLFGAIDSLQNLLNVPQQRNFQRWPVLGTYVWPNAFIGNNYQQEVDYLEFWLANRLGWLDAQIATLYTKPEAEPGNIKTYPNPARDFLIFETGVSDDPYTVSLYTPDGKRVLEQQITADQEGLLRLEWPADGLSSGIYTARLMHGEKRVLTVKVMVRGWR
jgi:hypothetical protein